jgi:hypothetical protein
MSFDDGDQQALHWLPEQDRWEAIAWDDWLAFRGVLAPSIGLPGLAAGIHHFAVCVHDDGVAINVLPHRYLIEPDGRIGSDNGLSRAERRDYSRLLLAMQLSAQDKARLREIQHKQWRVHLPPPTSIPALRRALPKPPQPGSLAYRFFDQDFASPPE